MILVDANYLLYAEDSQSPYHDRSRAWWDAQLSGASPVCLTWEVISAFIRIATNRRVYRQPITIQEAIARVESWLSQPCVRVLSPTGRHWDVFQRILVEGKAVGGLVSDAHLAALAIEHGCVLATTDADFSRFRGLKTSNPIQRPA